MQSAVVSGSLAVPNGLSHHCLCAAVQDLNVGGGRSADLRVDEVAGEDVAWLGVQQLMLAGQVPAHIHAPCLHQHMLAPEHALKGVAQRVLAHKTRIGMRA